MEIRTLKARERLEVASLLDGWRLAEGWTAGDRFRQQAEWDPTWHDENVLVAVDRGAIVAAVTIHPRQIRILGHAVPCGGAGSLYTAPTHRQGGLATELLERACEAMRERGLELAIAFPAAQSATPGFFEKRGWFGWGGQQTILRVDPEGRGAGGAVPEEIELLPVDPSDERALQSVKSIHAAYSASRSGPLVRDDALWRAGLQATFAPREEFWIARRGGLTVAYARAALSDDVLTITELGRFEDGSTALAHLIAQLLTPRENDPLLPAGGEGRVASQQLRAFAVLPAFDDIGLTVALEHGAIRSHPMDETRASLRCANLMGFASRLDVDLLPGEDGSAFLRRILPPDAMVFWPADRF